MLWAKQSTAATLIIGPVLDSAGAEYTSAVIGDLSISKNGGTLTAMAAAATLTHIANGQYTLVTTTGNTDTLGRAQITCNKSTYQMPSMELMILPAMVFDSMVLGTDVIQSDVTQLLGTAWLTPATAGTPDVNTKTITSGAVNAGALGADTITASKIATGAFTSDKFAISAVDKMASGVWNADATLHQTQGTFGQAIGDPVADTNTIFKAVVTDSTGATVGVDVVALKAETVNILVDTAEIGTAGAGLTALSVDLSGVIIQRTLPSGEYVTREATNALVSGALIARDVATQGQLNARTVASASYLQQTNLDTLSINLSGVVYQRTIPSGEYATKTDVTNSAASGVTDWTTTERGQIRYRLGLDGSSSTPSATPTLASAAGLDNLSINLSGVIVQRTLPSGEYLSRDDIRIQTSGVLVGWGTVNQTYLDSRTIAAANYATSVQINAVSGVLTAGVKVVELTSPAIEDIFSTFTIAEAYAAAGAAGTPAQLLYLTQQVVSQFSISGSGIIVKKLDNSTTAATYTMDSSSAPTLRGRTT